MSTNMYHHNFDKMNKADVCHDFWVGVKLSPWREAH